MTEAEELAAWKAVRDAYREARPPNLRQVDPMNLGSLAVQWLKSKDPSVMDGAISYCHQNKLPILPELLVHVHAAMQKRIANGSPGKKAFKESAKRRVLEEMAKLVYHGATTRRAAELGAYIAHFEIGYPMKASTLEKAFTKHGTELKKFAASVFEDPLFSHAENEQTAAMFREAIERDLVIPE